MHSLKTAEIKEDILSNKTEDDLESVQTAKKLFL